MFLAQPGRSAEGLGAHLAHVRDHVGLEDVDQMRRAFFAKGADGIVEGSAQHDEIGPERQGAADVEAAGDAAESKTIGRIGDGRADCGQAGDRGGPAVELATRVV